MSTRLSPTPGDAERELVRVADRLRVIGPRLAARSTAESAAVLAQVRAGLQHLADLTASASGETVRPVPELSPYALADQLLVLGHDLLASPAASTDARRATAVSAVTAIYALL